MAKLFILDGDNLLARHFHQALHSSPRLIHKTNFLLGRLLTDIQAYHQLYGPATVRVVLSTPAFDGRAGRQVEALPAQLAEHQILTTAEGAGAMHRTLLTAGTAEQPAVVFSYNKAWLGYVRPELSMHLAGQYITAADFPATTKGIIPAGLTPQEFALFQVLAGSSTRPGLKGWGESTAAQFVRTLSTLGVHLGGPVQPWVGFVRELRAVWNCLSPDFQGLLPGESISKFKELYLARYPEQS